MDSLKDVLDGIKYEFLKARARRLAIRSETQEILRLLKETTLASREQRIQSRNLRNAIG